MNFRTIFGTFLLLFSLQSWSAECTLYETMHPKFALTGAHLSTGKCATCASCHINGVFNGTPRTCVACHNGDPSRLTVGRGPLHIPTMLIDCDSCHKTITFTTGITMNHLALGTMKCITCHATGTNFAGGMERKSLTHERKTPVPTDCSMAGCHRPGGKVGTLYRAWD